MIASRISFSFCVVVALLVGCGGSQLPIGAPGTMPQAPASAAHAERGTSWMAADAASQDLLYVANTRTVAVYAYPGGKLEGVLRHFYIATGTCVDKSGNVFVADVGYGKIFEYAHGRTKRLATLQGPSLDPAGCSIDPTTGDLAVSSLGSGSGTVAVFKNARGKPTVYGDSAFYQFYFCSYDNSGNLFADGLTDPGSGNFGLVELPKGKSKLTNITIAQYISFPGGVEWDGQYLAIGDQNSHVIYRVSVQGSQGTTVGTVQMGSGAEYVQQFWIQGTTLIAPNEYPLHSDVLFFDYPAGGKAVKTITRRVNGAKGAVVSLTAVPYLMDRRSTSSKEQVQ